MCRGLISADSGCGGGSGMPETVVVLRRCRQLNSLKCLQRKVQEKTSNLKPHSQSAAGDSSFHFVVWCCICLLLLGFCEMSGWCEISLRYHDVSTFISRFAWNTSNVMSNIKMILSFNRNGNTPPLPSPPFLWWLNSSFHHRKAFSKTNALVKSDVMVPWGLNSQLWFGVCPLMTVGGGEWESKVMQGQLSKHTCASVSLSQTCTHICTGEDLFGTVEILLSVAEVGSLKWLSPPTEKVSLHTHTHAHETDQLLSLHNRSNFYMNQHGHTIMQINQGFKLVIFQRNLPFWIQNRSFVWFV